MEKPSNQPPKSRMMPRKERDGGASAPPRRNPQRKPKVDQLSEASVRKEKLQTHVVKMGQETEVKLKSTVVDIDSVRDDEVKDDNMGLLEVEEQEDRESECFLFFPTFILCNLNTLELFKLKSCGSLQV